MDVSETYIKMCDCPEIQGQWKPEEGDFHTGGSYLGCVGDELYDDEEESAEDAIKEIKTYTWLPRQDQIQEMMGVEGLCQNWIFFLRFYIDKDWIITNYGLKLKTQEQLWFAFYMWEKHKKTWDGKEWIKEEKNATK